MSVTVVEAADIAAVLTRADAVAAIEDALRAGQDVEADGPRLFRELAAGEFLLMPAESPDHAGVKVATVAPGNPARGLAKIHAWYLLFDAATLRPTALLEGTFLTIVRTPAVTAVAVRALLNDAPGGPRDRIERLLVMGTGPQAEAHVRTLADVLPVGGVGVVGRDVARAEALAERLTADGIAARAATRDDTRGADVIVTATSSSQPVLDLDDVAPDAVVAAIGAHGAHRRELGAALVRGADLVVEARSSAFRESGNLLLARTRQEWESAEQPVANLRELLQHGLGRRPGRPAVYAGVGMSWEDLAIAEKIMERLAPRGPGHSEEGAP